MLYNYQLSKLVAVIWISFPFSETLDCAIIAIIAQSDNFLVGWALPTTTSGAVVKSSINSGLTDCSYNILKKLS